MCLRPYIKLHFLPHMMPHLIHLYVCTLEKTEVKLCSVQCIL